VSGAGRRPPAPAARRERPPLPPGPYLVVGLARSGAAAALMLSEHGVVIGCDAGRPAEAETLEGVEVHLESDGVELVDGVRTVVKSPGVPSSAPAVVAARERGLEVTGELELAWRLLSAELVAVTGTNGKTTTSELLGAIHRRAGIEVAVAGNMGTPLAALAGGASARRPSHADAPVGAGDDPRGVSTAPPAPEVIVCESSSFQLEDSSTFAPEAAVLLNIEEDHLDRHGTVEAYRRAKLRVFANQRAGDVAVVPVDLASEPSAAGGKAEVVTFGGAEADLTLADGELRMRGEPLMPAAEIRLRGAHNRENAMAAAAAALARHLDPVAVADALATFAGIRHRLEEVGRRDGVLYVNDSKATNVASALVGIEAFDGGVHVILGGSLKGGGFEGLREAVRARCAAAYLIGEAAERLAEDLEGAAPLHRCGDLERAVAASAASARPGEVVLLSPACASFDQYRDFEERGDHFRALARGMG
jgi:UDP-N-acetylmuramoylalanine--D-glutamate ligase